MKKLMIVMIAAVGFNVASAQNWNNNSKPQRYDSKQVTDNRHYNDQQQPNDYAYKNSNNRNEEYDRRGDVDRMNRQSDERNNGYGNERRYDPREKSRRVVVHGRQQSRNEFGKGVIAGGIAGVLLGVLIGH